jgi:hypothetical protein
MSKLKNSLLFLGILLVRLTFIFHPSFGHLLVSMGLMSTASLRHNLSFLTTWRLEIRGPFLAGDLDFSESLVCTFDLSRGALKSTLGALKSKTKLSRGALKSTLGALKSKTKLSRGALKSTHGALKSMPKMNFTFFSLSEGEFLVCNSLFEAYQTHLHIYTLQREKRSQLSNTFSYEFLSFQRECDENRNSRRFKSNAQVLFCLRNSRN